MAATVTLVERFKMTNGIGAVVDILFDNSYPTNGEAVTLPLSVVKEVFFQQKSGYMFEYNKTAGKVKVYTPVGAVTAHTHAVALDGGASAGEAAHTHAVALDTGASAAGSSHTHSPSQRALLLSHGGSDIKGSANTDSENADQASLPTNGALVGAETAVAAGAYAFPATAHPDIGRNVCIAFRNDSGGPLNLYEGVMPFTVTGTWRGAVQTDTITYTSSAGNKSIANTKYRYKYGVKPFDTVTNVTVDNICDNGIKIAVGIGSKIGLPTDLKTPEANDVVKVTKNAAHYNASTEVNTIYMTVNLAALADADDFNIVYKAVEYISEIAAEATHTHGPGSLADAASGAGSSHTHGPGTLADAASGTGGAIAAAAAAELANESSALDGVTVRAIAIGY